MHHLSVISCLIAWVCSKACFINMLHWEKGAILLPYINWTIIIVDYWFFSGVLFVYYEISDDVILDVLCIICAGKLEKNGP